MSVAVDNTALFRARTVILSKTDESLGNGRKEQKVFSMGGQQLKDARTTTESNFSLHCSHARQIVADVTELRDLVLDKRKEYILCSNAFSLYGVQKFMSDEDRRKFDQETDLAFKHCTKLIRSLEAQIESDRALRQSDQRKHLVAVTNLLNIYLKEVLSIVTQLRTIHVRKSRQIRRICRLANLVEMYGPQIEQSQKEEEEKALKLARMLEELKDNEKRQWEKEETREENKENILNGIKKGEKMAVVDGWDDAQIEDELLGKPAVNKISSDGWEEAQFDEVKKEEVKQPRVEQSELLEENRKLFERFTSSDAELSKIETQMSEIQRLQNIFAEKIDEQEYEIDVIHSRTVYTLDNLETANEFIREAIKNQANRRVILIFCLLVLTFTLLFLDWYNP